HESHAVVTQQPNELRSLEAVVAHLQGMPDRAAKIGRRKASPRYAVVVVAREGCGGLGILRELLEEGGDPVRVVLEGAGDLPEDGAEAVAERENPRGEEVGQRGLRAPELLVVCDEAASLHGVDEATRARFPPRFIVCRPLE